MADIITLAGKFKNAKELQLYTDSQYIALKSALDEITRLKEEVSHLKQLLSSTVPLVGEPPIEKIIVSQEQAILEAQISHLHERALSRELTLEETKRLDLLIKNLNLVKGKPTGIIDAQSKKIDKNKISDAQLVYIASQEDKQDKSG